MFDGRKEHTVDTKGRVSVPERFRTVFADEDRQEVILSWSWSPGRLCIAAWTPSHWQDFLNKIANEPLSDELNKQSHYFKLFDCFHIRLVFFWFLARLYYFFSRVYF